MNHSAPDRSRTSPLLSYLMSALGGAVTLGGVNGYLSKHDVKRDILVGAVIGAIYFFLIAVLKRMGETRRWRRSIRESIPPVITLTGILLNSSIINHFFSLGWMPFQLLISVIVGGSIFISQEVSWKRRWFPLLGITCIGTMMGIWIFYYVDAELPLLMTRSMLREDLSPTELLFNALFSSFYITLLVYDLGGLWLVIKDWNRPKAR